LSQIVSELSFERSQLIEKNYQSNYWSSKKVNANPTGLTQEQILSETFGRAFIPHLIKKNYHIFSNQHHREEVVHSDPIARFVCDRFWKEVFAKPIKFYDYDVEGNPEEIMTDISQLIEQLMFKEVWQAIGQKLSSDGYCLTQLYLTPAGTPGYKTYGYFESPPEYWHRIDNKGQLDHNAIYAYYVSFLPSMMGSEYCSSYNIHAVEEWLFPQSPGFFHFYRGKWNWGVGESRLQGVWASLTMLRKISYADFRRSSIFNMLQFPEDWDVEKKVEPMLKAIRQVDETEGIAMAMRVNPQTQETEEWPRFFDRTMDQTGAMAKADPSSGGTLLRNAEYARVLIDLGYTETKFVGNQPGAVEGSKLDYTENDEVDMREFQTIKPVIKQTLVWLLQMGFLEGCEAESLQLVEAMDYDVKCHVEWEVLENQVREMELAAEQAEQTSEMGASKAKQNSDQYNRFVESQLIEAMKNNAAMPMTPVMSSWIKGIGFNEGTLYMTTHQGYSYRKPVEDAMSTYYAWADSGSKGGYWWDQLAERNPPWERVGRISLPKMFGAKEYEQIAAEGQQYKMEGEEEKGVLGAGTTREPMTAKMVPQYRQLEEGATSMAYAKPPKYGEKDWSPSNPKQAGRKRSKGRSTTRATKSKGWTVSTADMPATMAVHAKGVARAASLPELTLTQANILWEEFDPLHKTMSKSTWVKIKKLYDAVQQKYQIRDNSIDIGNPMNFDTPLVYVVNGKPSVEFACKKEWKKIQPHEGALWLYDSLNHEGERYNVGTYSYKWDEQKDMPIIERNIDDEYVKELLTKWKKTNSIIFKKIVNNEPVSMSTEYYCGTKIHDGKKYQVGFHNGNGEPILKGIAIVEKGNCDEPFCNFKIKREEENEHN